MELGGGMGEMNDVGGRREGERSGVWDPCHDGETLARSCVARKARGTRAMHSDGRGGAHVTCSTSRA
jgi:hypothetical protein